MAEYNGELFVIRVSEDSDFALFDRPVYVTSGSQCQLEPRLLAGAQRVANGTEDLVIGRSARERLRLAYTSNVSAGPQPSLSQLDGMLLIFRTYLRIFTYLIIAYMHTLKNTLY